MENNRNEQLWQIAQKRVKFKMSAYTYIVINIFLWCIFLFSGTKDNSSSPIPWPAWVSLGWGVGLAFQYFNAYAKTGDTLQNKEYEKLVKKEKEKL